MHVGTARAAVIAGAFAEFVRRVVPAGQPHASERKGEYRAPVAQPQDAKAILDQMTKPEAKIYGSLKRKNYVFFLKKNEERKEWNEMKERRKKERKKGMK